MQAWAIPANRWQPCGDFTPAAARATICFCRRFIFRRFKSMKPAIESGTKASCSAVYRVCRVRIAAAIRKFSEDGDSQHLRVLPVRTFPYDNASFHNTRRGPIPCTALFWYFYALFQDGGEVGRGVTHPRACKGAKEQQPPQRTTATMVRVAGLEPTASTESSHCRGAALTLAPLCA